MVSLFLWGGFVAEGAVVFQGTSPYHHIRVVDQQGVRTLSFDGSMETRMSLANPLQGHFEYIEHFHMPWIWNREIKKVLMIGLGGGSIQRSFQHYYPDVKVQTVELDPIVVEVAKNYFFVEESPALKIEVGDGRMFLRRTEEKYDLIILDAYTSNRYGSFIPHQLATKEFFELAKERLTENGVLAYNVMGRLQGWRADLLGAVYKTMKTVYPQVYLFPSQSSQNVVLIATRSEEFFTPLMVRQRAEVLARTGRVRLPTFRNRVLTFSNIPPPGSFRAPVLTDDHAPVGGLLRR